MNDRPYEPIDCALHDRIEAAATKRAPLRIVFTHDGAQVEVQDVPTDWFVHDGAEYMRTAGGLVIRLDRIQRLG